MIDNAAYRVLARKYRPSSFKDLIGQDVLVRTLSNAIASGRIAHAFVLTGIRGIGKTTTARIIARALNCTGPNGDGGPTISPCGVCHNCVAMGNDRHVDVIEMDAATNTGVDNMRDIIEAVQYAPAIGRYKIFIIDEVHMLSKSAFNALLKTLEEPPPYIKFIFATTELRKIPVTILSRCQRFDLKRLDTETLAAHLGNVCAQEQVQAEPEALMLIAGAGDGSVRDSLSLLDQAMAHSTAEGGTIHIRTETVRDMLGLVDRRQVFALIEQVSRGQTAEALATYRGLHSAGADAATLLEDMAELVHFITQVRIDAALAEDVTYAQADRDSAKALAAELSIPALSRLWQMLLKGLQEVQYAPSPHTAVQMVLIRVAHAGMLPTPSELMQQLQSGNGVGGGGAAMPAMNAPRAAAPSAAAPVRAVAPSAPAASATQPTASRGNAAVAMAPAPVTMQAAPVAAPMLKPGTMHDAMEAFAALVQRFATSEPILYHYLQREARLVALEEGRLELQLSDAVPKDSAGRIGRCLSEWTGNRWMVVLSQSAATPTLHELAESKRASAFEQAGKHPLVQEALVTFAGSELTDVQLPNPTIKE